MRFRSILSHILWLHVAAIGITGVAMPLALYELLRSTAANLEQRALMAHADTVSHYLKVTPDGHWTLTLPAELRSLYAESYGRYAFAVLDATGRVLFASAADGRPILTADPLSGAPRFFQRRVDGASYDGASVPEPIDGRTVWVQVSEDLSHRDVLIDDIVRDFFTRIGWITLPILLVLLVIDAAIVRRALRPVLDASDRAQAIEPARIDLRLPTRGMPREILALVNAVNQALDRLEGGFRTQREFTADAAHELRTPLTILRTRIDMTVTDPTVARTLRDDIDGMARIVNQLLAIAELEGFVVDPGETADLKSVCSEVVAFLAPLALARGREIALTGDKGPVWIKGNGDILFQAVRNLAENAITHTAPGTTVEVEVGQGSTLRVRDAGPGVPPEERELIFRRFWRRDRRRSGSAGLGLSIVARIVEAHGGTIMVEDRPGGGAVFTASFVPA